jgi:hypothetical protein
MERFHEGGSLNYILLLYCLRKDFTQNVIPDLIKPAPYLIRGNPVFLAEFPCSRE